MRIARLCCLLLLAGSSLAAQAKMAHRPVEWTQDGTRFHSVLVYDDATQAKRPGLVMVPNWYGVNDAAVQKAEASAGKDYVGVCLDSGNPLWTLEDPHLTLETLHPYVLTSHTRDTAVWNTPDGSAVTWVRMGEGNVGIDDYMKRFVELCPGRPLSLESIVFGPRPFPWRKPEFWKPYPRARASEFTRFLEISEKGKPVPDYAWERGKDLEREDLEASLQHVRKLFSI